MDPIEAIEELARRFETLLAASREAESRVTAAQAEANEWKLKAEDLESRLAARNAEVQARDERMEKAAARVKALLEQLPTEN